MNVLGVKNVELQNFAKSINNIISKFNKSELL